MGLTLVEKIVGSHAVGRPAGAPPVRVGDYVQVRPRHVLTHDNTAAVMPKFASIGTGRVRYPSQPVLALDHNIQDASEGNRDKYRRIEAFAAEHGLAFFPAGRGIGHQVMVEEGFAVPGAFVVGSDSHSNLYGAVGALGTPVVRTDAAVIWATGETWWQVPPVARVRLSGRLAPGVSGKDVILALIGLVRDDEVLNHAVEFQGEAIADLSMDRRLTIANMTTEWGALAGIFPCDGVTADFLSACGGERLDPATVARLVAEAPAADGDAEYAVEIDVDLSTLGPYVTGPNEVKVAKPLAEIAARRIPVDRAYLLSCVNSRLDDIIEAAGVVGEGGRFAEGVRFYLAAASDRVEAAARANGAWQTLLDAGAIALPPGCGPCIGLGEGLIEPGEVGISATNRNFRGRMGSRDGEVYLASPAVVAASALAGHITGPSGAGADGGFKPELRRVEPEPPPAGGGAAGVVEGFPKLIRGRVLYLPKDNMNTDGIYGKDYTYREDLTPEQMGAVAMENYDPGFQAIAKPGDILVGGRNFGTGSSREQAATALSHRGIPLVIAATLSQTYQRNAFNNGFPVLACPPLVDFLAERLAERVAAGELTLDSGLEAEVDFTRSEIRCGGSAFPFPRLSEVPQRLVAAGGAEALARAG